jgi:hypothetical protein
VKTVWRIRLRNVTEVPLQVISTNYSYTGDMLEFWNETNEDGVKYKETVFLIPNATETVLYVEKVPEV